MKYLVFIVFLFVPEVRLAAEEELVCNYSTNSIFDLVHSHRITSFYGMREHPLSGEKTLHAGVDIGAKRGTLVYPFSSGVVISVATKKGYGRTVIIDHGKTIKTFYAHLSKILVKPGVNISKDVPLGRVGRSGKTTGPHLHFELEFVDEKINPLKAEDLYAMVYSGQSSCFREKRTEP